MELIPNDRPEAYLQPYKHLPQNNCPRDSRLLAVTMTQDWCAQRLSRVLHIKCYEYPWLKPDPSNIR